jgi:hypothetical protein
MSLFNSCFQSSAAFDSHEMDCNVSKENRVAHTKAVLTGEECQSLLDSAGPLGQDPVSQSFAVRFKSIAFVLCGPDDTFFHIRHDFFEQAATYNRSSGGFRRYYKELPRTFLENDAVVKVMKSFRDYCGAPVGGVMLVQVQRSEVSPDQNAIRRSITGQGIHSDGADQAMLVCLSRDRVEGAESAIYADLNGRHAVLPPFVLHAGNGLYWQDNKVYHHVSKAECAAQAEEINTGTNEAGTRTVLIAHYPAFMFMTGAKNPNNALVSNEATSAAVAWKASRSTRQARRLRG